MIQRIQSVYLLLAAVLGGLCLFMPIGSLSIDGAVEANLYGHDFVESFKSPIPTPGDIILFALLFVPSGISAVSIFLYSNRRIQAALCLLGVFTLVLWYILYAVIVNMLLSDVPGREFSPSWAAFLPLASTVLNMLARRAILGDEKLVRAADRIR